jgi:molybdate transport system substrate-binding protein
VGCQQPQPIPPAAGDDTPGSLLVAAAADLAGVQQPLVEAFQKLRGRRIEMVLGSSGILARQVEQGAPYDVYLSANEEYVRALAMAGKLESASVVVYAVGRLGVWSRGGHIADLDDLTSDRVMHVAMANPAHAPYGVAARQALEKLGLWAELQPKIVYGENVRQALQYAESGNAEAAITAWALVYDRGGNVVPDHLHAPIRQTAGIVRASPRAGLARGFLEFLTGPEGRQILQQRGFAMPRDQAGL